MPRRPKRTMYDSSDEQLSPYVGATTYEEQRKVRLTDAIFDYLSDDDVTAQQTYDDLINTIKDDASYYKKHYDRCRDLLFKIGYFGPVDEDVMVTDGVAKSVAEPEPHLKAVPSDCAGWMSEHD